LDIISILSYYYDEYFGFTQKEVDEMLQYYGLETKREELREWYNGYLFGNKVVYNPWSSIRIVSDWRKKIDSFPTPYWANTSSNDIVRALIDRADDDIKEDLGILTSGATISKPVHEDITYDEIYKSANNLWNFLVFTGYLRKIGDGKIDENGVLTLNLAIPNIELRYIYHTKIQEWFDKKVEQRDFKNLYDAILKGNAELLQEELGDFLLDTISYMDGKEDFYHGFMLGVLSGMSGYSVKSNRETGLGRCDIVMKHRSGRGKAVIFELKWTTDMKEIEKKRDEALKQIIDGKYVKELEDQCYNDIIKYGIAFCKKSCEVGKL
jgi:hypothetical protein